MNMISTADDTKWDKCQEAAEWQVCEELTGWMSFRERLCVFNPIPRSPVHVSAQASVQFVPRPVIYYYYYFLMFISNGNDSIYLWPDGDNQIYRKDGRCVSGPTLDLMVSVLAEHVICSPMIQCC